MRYTHGIKLIRKRPHVGKISLAITLTLVLLIVVLGFTSLNAERFFIGFVESLYRVSLSYVIALVLALVLALIISASKVVEEVLVPILDVLQSFPSFALFPLFVLWFGKTSIVTIIILIAEMIWPILFTVLTAHKQIREDVLEAAKSFKAQGLKLLWFVIIPLIFPAIITGSIVAWGEAWEAIIAAEIIVNIAGVGSYLADIAASNHPEKLAIGILALMLILFLINKYLWLPLLNISTKYQQD